MRPKWARWPANRPDWPVQSLRRRVWATRFFENSVTDAFDAHFFNGLLENSLPARIDYMLVRKFLSQHGIQRQQRLTALHTPLRHIQDSLFEPQSSVLMASWSPF